MCFSQCCYSCHLKVVLDRVVPSCLQSQGHRGSLAAAGSEARQLTLEEILYPPPSWEVEGTPARRSSPKVCPVNLDAFSDDGDRSEGGYSPAVNETSVVSVVSRASARSQHSLSRRVSFRSPDESDVFIIPARSDSDYEEEESSDVSIGGCKQGRRSAGNGEDRIPSMRQTVSDALVLRRKN